MQKFEFFQKVLTQWGLQLPSADPLAEKIEVCATDSANSQLMLLDEKGRTHQLNISAHYPRGTDASDTFKMWVTESVATSPSVSTKKSLFLIANGSSHLQLLRAYQKAAQSEYVFQDFACLAGPQFLRQSRKTPVYLFMESLTRFVSNIVNLYSGLTCEISTIVENGRLVDTWQECQESGLDNNIYLVHFDVLKDGLFFDSISLKFSFNPNAQSVPREEIISSRLECFCASSDSVYIASIVSSYSEHSWVTQLFEYLQQFCLLRAVKKVAFLLSAEFESNAQIQTIQNFDDKRIDFLFAHLDSPSEEVLTGPAVLVKARILDSLMEDSPVVEVCIDLAWNKRDSYLWDIKASYPLDGIGQLMAEAIFLSYQH